MADITLTCGTCGNRITISEYVEAEFMTCAKCRAKVTIPPKQTGAAAAARLKLAPSMQPEPEVPAASATPPARTQLDEVRQNMPFMRRRQKRPRRALSLGRVVAAYAVFAALAGGLLYLRLSPPSGMRELLILGGLWALAIMHVSVIIGAFAEDAFHGILTVIIPGYTIFYLFVYSDRFFQRALAAALLVAFGLDAVSVIRHYSHDTYVSVSAWMQDAGPLKKIDVPPMH